jgi:hypothetical protein
MDSLISRLIRLQGGFGFSEGADTSDGETFAKFHRMHPGCEFSELNSAPKDGRLSFRFKTEQIALQ